MDPGFAQTDDTTYKLVISNLNKAHYVDYRLWVVNPLGSNSTKIRVAESK
jgi:hypothetical protein